jgi:hypothetical protein
MSAYRQESTGMNRRQMIKGALVTGAALGLPSKVFATAAPPSINKKVIDVAKREIEKHRGKVWLRDLAGVADFSLNSGVPRFYLIDLVGGKMKSFLVTHGAGSDVENDGWLKSFSNINGSKATSRGAYSTRPWYTGKHGLSMRLIGLEQDNYNAEDRAIVIHSSWYANPRMVSEFGRLGRSEGCFVFPEDNLLEILGRLGPGRLLFADQLSGPPVRPVIAPTAPVVQTAPIATPAPPPAVIPAPAVPKL